MINLGDPVVRLSKKKNSSASFDRTIGTSITTAKSGTIESYSKLDANGDGFPDVAVFYDDGRIELVQNYRGTLKSIGYLAYVADAGTFRK